MNSKPMDNEDWAALGTKWRTLEADLELSESELQRRLRRQRTLVALMGVAEAVSLAIALGVAVWMMQYAAIGRFGPALIVWLLLQAAGAFWMRRRQPTTYDTSVLERLDASIEHDSRIVESLRLGSLMGSIALAAMTVAVAFSLRNGLILASPPALACCAFLFIYVFAIQVVIIVYARQVQRRRKRLENIRRSLTTLE
jgi:membrane protein YdbS with pleckstrin-like domain